MNIPEVSEEARKYLKNRPSGGDTKAWIAIRTVLNAFTEHEGMSSRVLPVLDRVKPELTGSLLDVGCYGGWLYPRVRDFVDYTGIDSWPDAVEVAKGLFGDRFELCDLTRYKKQHDIVWATQLHPAMDVPTIFPHLRSLAKKMLVVTFNRSIDVIDGGQLISNPDGLVAAVYRD